MHRFSHVILLSAAVSGVGACGDRTELLAVREASGGDLDGAIDDGAYSADGGILCSLYAGPVDSCDAGAAAGPVQRCTAEFSRCSDTDIPGEGWGCCIPNPGGDHNDCTYTQFLDDASCQ